MSLWQHYINRDQNFVKDIKTKIHLLLTFETRYSTASDVTVRAMEDIIEDMLTIAEDGLLGVDDLAAWRRSGKKA